MFFCVKEKERPILMERLVLLEVKSKTAIMEYEMEYKERKTKNSERTVRLPCTKSYVILLIMSKMMVIAWYYLIFYVYFNDEKLSYQMSIQPISGSLWRS